ncbi:MAG: hypothetical protein WC179_08750 [Candidatus Cloacimonadaceae bacterium]
MTLGEFRKVTQDMSDDSVIIANIDLIYNATTYSVMTDEKNKEVIIMVGEEE